MSNSASASPSPSSTSSSLPAFAESAFSAVLERFSTDAGGAAAGAGGAAAAGAEAAAEWSWVAAALSFLRARTSVLSSDASVERLQRLITHSRHSGEGQGKEEEGEEKEGGSGGRRSAGGGAAAVGGRSGGSGGSGGSASSSSSSSRSMDLQGAPIPLITAASASTSTPSSASSPSASTSTGDGKGGLLPVERGSVTPRYTWTQSLSEVNVSLPPLPASTSSKQLQVQLSATHLTITLRPSTPLIPTTAFHAAILPDDSTWTLESEGHSKTLRLYLRKGHCSTRTPDAHTHPTHRHPSTDRCCDASLPLRLSLSLCGPCARRPSLAQSLAHPSATASPPCGGRCLL